jgi:hypothetical protein
VGGVVDVECAITRRYIHSIVEASRSCSNCGRYVRVAKYCRVVKYEEGDFSQTGGLR